MNKKIIFLLLCLSIYAHSMAHGYVSDQRRQPSQTVSYFVNPYCADEQSTNIENAIQVAARTWNNEGNANFNFTYAGQTSKTLPDEDGRDGYNQIMFVQDTGYWYFDENPNILATTVIWYSASTYEILECDVAFNDENYTFSTQGTPGNNMYDVWNIAAHEFGHFLWLGHTSYQAATMYSITYSEETKKRDLHSDDIEGIQYLYGAAPNANPIVSDGFVSPMTGNETTEIGFYVDYYDADGNAPTTARVYINGTGYDMSLISGNAANGHYAYITQLPALNTIPLQSIMHPSIKLFQGDNRKNIGVNKPLIGEAYQFYFYFEDGQGGSDMLPIVNPAAEEPFLGPVIYKSIE